MMLLFLMILNKNKIISTSKIKNIIVIKKNGKFAFVIGLNPHSNGELFS